MKRILLLFLLEAINGYLIIVANGRDNIITGVDSTSGTNVFTKAFPSYGSGTPILYATAYSPNVSVIWFVDVGNTVAPRFIYWDLSADTFGTGAYVDPGVNSFSDIFGFWIDFTGVAYTVLFFGTTPTSLYKVADFATNGINSHAVLQWTQSNEPYQSVNYNYGDGNIYGLARSDGKTYLLNSTGNKVSVEVNSTTSSLGYITFNRTGGILIFMKLNGALITLDYLSQGTTTTASTSIGSVVGITFWDESIADTFTTGDITTSPLTSGDITTSPLTSGQITTSPLTTSPLTTSPVTTGQVTSGALTSGQITTSPLTSGQITTSPLTTSPLTSGQITTSPLTSGQITTSPLTSGQITTSPLTTSPLTTSPLTSGQITTSPLTSGQITTGVPFTTSPLTTSPLTSGQITTSPLTSGDITTSPLTTSPLTSGDITTSPLTTSPLTTGQKPHVVSETTSIIAITIPTAFAFIFTVSILIIRMRFMNTGYRVVKKRSSKTKRKIFK